MIQFSSNVVAGTVLVRSAIQSPNYAAGVSGWTINQDGSVEFNNLNARGILLVSNVSGSYIRLFASGDATVADFSPATDALAAGDTVAPGYVLTEMYDAPTIQSYVEISSPIGLRNNGADGITPRSFVRLFSGTVTGTGNDQIILESDNVEVIGSLILHNRYDSGAAAQVFVGTGMQNVAGLDNIVLQPGAEYSYELHAAYDAAAATDAKFAWTSSGVVTVTVLIDRFILGPTLGAASNINTSMISIRRAINSQQQVGGCAGVANAFTGYHEYGVITNTDPVNTQTITFQAAEVVAGAGVTVQGHSWVKLTRHA